VVPAGGGDVASDLVLQSLDRREPHLVPQPLEKFESDLTTVQIACKVQ
jgi:hypothetical protein